MAIDVDRSAGDGGRRGRRWRIAAGVGAAMLVAAAGGLGFGIGRSLDDDGGDADLIVPGQEPPTTDAAPTTDLPSPEPTADTVPAPERTGDEPATTDVAPVDQPADGGLVTAEMIEDVGASGSPGWSQFGESDMEQIYDRTTADGLVLRAQLGTVWDHDAEFGDEFSPFGDWQPPGWCYQNGEVRLSIAAGTPDIIDVGGVPWFSEPYQDRNVSWLTLGRADGNPHRVVFVQAIDGSTSITATFGDGSTDTADVQNGVAVLVVAGAPATIVHQDGPYEWVEELPDFTVSFEGGPEPTMVDSSQVGTWNDPEVARSCSPPPPALPEPGEQPVDPAAAEADILAVIDTLYGLTEDEADLADLVDDPTGVAEAQEQVADGSFADAVASVEVVVEELVFTTPEEAWYRYRIETDVTDLWDRYGTAVYVDGAWKLTRDTICQDIGMAGGSCGLPTTSPISPPRG